MSSPKHLVLDEDVHRALRKRKHETGLNVKTIGNCALRSVLEGPLLSEVIGEKLVAAGKLSESEYAAIRQEATQEVCHSAGEVASLVRPTRDNTVTSGSWEIREISTDLKHQFQVLEAWVRDRRLRPITLHQHRGHEYLVLLSGAIMATVDLETRIVRAPGSLMIPGGAFHSVTPLDRDTRLIAVVSPPEPGYQVVAD